MNEMIVLPGEVALGALDLDDARARIGQLAGGIGRRDRLLDRNNQKSLEIGSHGSSSLPAAARAYRITNGFGTSLP